MKIEKILDNLNSFEKNAFLKILDNIITNKPKNAKLIDQILGDSSRDLKNIDNLNIANVFRLVEQEFSEYLRKELIDTVTQLDILTDIIIRDGNSIMKQDWFSRLYDNEISILALKLKEFKNDLDNEKSDIPLLRKRDCLIYRACLYTAYTNDDECNLERKITSDEQSVLLTLSHQLGLSQEEIKLIKYLIIPIQKTPIDDVINELRSLGIIFYSKKTNTIYIADGIIRLIRQLRGKEIADKHFRRVLRHLKESQIRQICKKYRIDSKLPEDRRIKEIINKGVSFSNVLINDIYKDGTKVTEKKQFITDLCDKSLKISPPLKGIRVEEKVDNLIKYFENIEKDEKVGISIDGYEKLLIDLNKSLTDLNHVVKNEFELQEEKVLKSNYLLDYNIKPRDILDLISEEALEEYCKEKSIKTRGNLIYNILEAYKDVENLYLENYENIGYRNLALLKENGITIKEAELGVKFEDITKNILTKLGFNVDEKLRKKINTTKDKADIIVNVGNNDLILIECKTVKESGYNRFSSVSRQLKAYSERANAHGYNVIKSLLIAPDFSDEFLKDCGLEYELNLSLITASSLLKILQGLKKSRHKKLPYNLLMRDVLIQEDRVLKAIER